MALLHWPPSCLSTRTRSAAVKTAPDRAGAGAIIASAPLSTPSGPHFLVLCEGSTAAAARVCKVVGHAICCRCRASRVWAYGSPRARRVHLSQLGLCWFGSHCRFQHACTRVQGELHKLQQAQLQRGGIWGALMADGDPHGTWLHAYGCISGKGQTHIWFEFSGSFLLIITDSLGPGPPMGFQEVYIMPLPLFFIF